MSRPLPPLDRLPVALGLFLRNLAAACLAVLVAGYYITVVADLGGDLRGVFLRNLAASFVVAVGLAFPLHLSLTRNLRQFLAPRRTTETDPGALARAAWRDVRGYPTSFPAFTMLYGLLLTAANVLLLARGEAGADGRVIGTIGISGVLVVANYYFLAQLTCESACMRLQAHLTGVTRQSLPATVPGLRAMTFSRRLALLLALAAASWAILTAVLVVHLTRNLMEAGVDPTAAAIRIGTHLSAIAVAFALVGFYAVVAVARQVARSMESLRAALADLGAGEGGSGVAPVIVGSDIANIASRVRGAVRGLNELETVRAAFARHGRYQVTRAVGSGALATVYRGQDTAIERPVALKVVHPQLCEEAEERARYRDRLLREARISGRVGHAGFVTVYDVGELPGGLLFMAREWIEGLSLHQRLRQGPLTLDEVRRLARDLAAALDHAHARGVVHRDLKPANILLTEAGDARIADLDIAGLEDEDAPDGVAATPGYASPEAVAGAGVDFRADQFALGAILFEALSGRSPLGRGGIYLALQASARGERGGRSAVADHLSPRVDAVLGRMTAHDPAARYGTLAEAVGALSRALDISAAGSGARSA